MQHFVIHSHLVGNTLLASKEKRIGIRFISVGSVLGFFTFWSTTEAHASIYRHLKNNNLKLYGQKISLLVVVGVSGEREMKK